MTRAAATPNTLTHEEKKEENHLQYIVHMFFNTQTQIKKIRKKCRSQFVDIVPILVKDSLDGKFEKRDTCERLYLFNSSYLRL